MVNPDNGDQILPSSSDEYYQQPNKPPVNYQEAFRQKDAPSQQRVSRFSGKTMNKLQPDGKRVNQGELWEEAKRNETIERDR